MVNVPQMSFANEALDNMLSLLDTTVLVTQELLKDTSFPLEERWALYLKAERVLPVDSCYTESSMILTDCAYDDLYMERYQTKLHSTIDEQIVGNYDPSDDNDGPYTKTAKRMYEKRDEWREAVLQEGLGGFTNDW